MSVTGTVRQARLRVAPSPGARPERPEDRAQDRTLSVADFQFRGGCPGGSRGLWTRTRIADAH
jgi:hypothetical protein